MTTSAIFAQQNQRRKNTTTASGVAKPEVKKRLMSAAAAVGGTADGDGKAARRQPRIQLYRPPAASKKHVTTESTGGSGSGRSSLVAPPRGTKQSKAAANSGETVAAVTKDWSGVKTLSEILHAKQQPQQRRKLRDQQQADVSDDDVNVASHINESTSKRTMTSHKVIGSNVILTTVSDNTAITAAAATGATSKRRIQRNVCGQHVTTQAAQRRHSRVR